MEHRELLPKTASESIGNLQYDFQGLASAFKMCYPSFSPLTATAMPIPEYHTSSGKRGSPSRQWSFLPLRAAQLYSHVLTETPAP